MKIFMLSFCLVLAQANGGCEPVPPKPVEYDGTVSFNKINGNVKEVEVLFSSNRIIVSDRDNLQRLIDEFESIVEDLEYAKKQMEIIEYPSKDLIQPVQEKGIKNE